MKLNYYPESDSLSIDLSSKSSKENQEISEGIVIDYDEDGHITEDVHGIRPRMVQKRLYKRLNLLRSEVIEPELIGNKDYKTLVIGWGSTYGVIKEAIENIEKDDLAFLYFKQVYPLNKKIGEILRKAEKTIILENNATSQLGKVLKLELGFDVDERFLKYNGMPFSTEEVTTYLEKLL